MIKIVWHLVVSNPTYELLRLPLYDGLFRIGPGLRADCEIGVLVAELEVDRGQITLRRSNQPDIDLVKTPFNIDGLKLRVERKEIFTHQSSTQSLHFPGREAAAPLLPIEIVPVGKEGKPILLDSGSLRIGTHPDNDFVVPSQFASAFHCIVFSRNQQWLIRDLGSKNGTYLSEVRVIEAIIQPPATLRIGETTLRINPLQKEAAPASMPLITGESEPVQKLRAQIARYAPTPAPVLIQGESGTGKELIARTLHDQSLRNAHPFVAINCGALAENLIESELFGHSKGAFTGANERRLGAFLSADSGTLFLDEIGELPIEVQPKLLRALETREIKAVGEDKPRQVDVRIIAATHRDLRKAVQAGQFREDLYHRLSVLTLFVPPLRERKEDVTLLANHFLALMLPKDRMVKFSLEAHRALARHFFSGNVRELRNAVLRGMVLAQNGVIAVEDLGLEGGIHPTVSEAVPPQPTATSGASSALSTLEREAIIRVLREAQGSRSAAAKKLGIARSTLYRKLEEYRISDQEIVGKSSVG